MTQKLIKRDVSSDFSAHVLHVGVSNTVCGTQMCKYLDLPDLQQHLYVKPGCIELTGYPDEEPVVTTS